ncbi:MAG: sulfurtransferase TusA family protein [Pseudomonadaceae bacterium]|nr:sulfurtransferase TusA family protein [Pseudomonadaceae bacterium]
MSETPYTVELDLRGLLCPLPVIRTQDVIIELKSGDTVRVLASDPGTAYDIPAWVRVHGHELIGWEDQGDELWFSIRVVDGD